MHERNFEAVQNRRLLMERKVGLIPLMAAQFERELNRRQWDQLASNRAPASTVLVKEFYANARSYGGEGMRYMSYVRGKRITYNVGTINTFLGTEWSGDDSQCQFTSLLEEDVDFAEYCMLDEEGLSVPPPQPSRVHRRSQPAQPDQLQAYYFQMGYMQMALVNAKFDALYRGTRPKILEEVACPEPEDDENEDDNEEEDSDDSRG
ncbi:hypothetical protein LR48_Vigan08g056300 [Vigna angularis]|uniref:Putative plant transposon protein domain-containing protein n=1 Tax=Phaseolus angularis TaxID=3914 RepID=A0A0L9V420_PHAAN|nr:hypothetical protein LR48_Vigan08g056300 [Vigna angularis]